MKKIEKVIQRADGQRKVELFRRRDGSFGFEEMKWSENENCWIPFGRYSECFADDLEIAESEARGRVQWVSQKALA